MTDKQFDRLMAILDTAVMALWGLWTIGILVLVFK